MTGSPNSLSLSFLGERLDQAGLIDPIITRRWKISRGVVQFLAGHIAPTLGMPLAFLPQERDLCHAVKL